jgi:acetylornithine deacetylase/succinyl-diaminopimelate desuccinylase-like protein
MPSLNVRGLRSATVGVLGRNIVPSTATASIDIRLVKGMDPRKTTDRVLRHIREQGYHVVETKPGADVRKKNARVAWVSRRRGYAALRTPMDLPIAKRIVRAVESARGDVVKLPTLGGSLPLSMFDEELHTPVVIVPIANHDNNQHAQNENLRIRNLWDGIETMAALLAMDDD